MDFVANAEEQIQEMLHTVKAKSFDDLFENIPPDLRLPPPHDDGMSEMEGLALIEAIAKKNTYHHYQSYLGAGAYEHYIPAIVGAICSKSEFLTAYTPYQAEASQGTLQAIFEFQSAICALTGLDVANASVYDGASATAEAALLALRHHKTRKTIVAAASLHPRYLQVVSTYLANQEAHLLHAPTDAIGNIDKEKLVPLITTDVAAIIVPYPSFFGTLEDLTPIASLAHSHGALTIVVANPIVYGLFATAKEMGADIAVGDMQPFGIPTNLGGPYAGYMACQAPLARQMPGRLVGATKDIHGQEGYVLTMQPREQHIRREKATSNICTNQNLAALASLIAIVWYGKEGVRALALDNYQKANYLKQALAAIPHIDIPQHATTTFNEFIAVYPHTQEHVAAHFAKRNIIPGLPLEKFFPERQGQWLVAATEVKTLENLEHYIAAAKELV